jgi:hypothetical protein
MIPGIKLKRSIILGFALLLSTLLLQAQTNGPDERAKMLAIICRDFNVGPKEGTVIVQAIQYNRDKLLATLHNKALSAGERKSRIRQLLAERRGEIKKLLTPQQQQRLSELQLQKRMEAQGKGQKSFLLRNVH